MHFANHTRPHIHTNDYEKIIIPVHMNIRIFHRHLFSVYLRNVRVLKKENLNHNVYLCQPFRKRCSKFVIMEL